MIKLPRVKPVIKRDRGGPGWLCSYRYGLPDAAQGMGVGKTPMAAWMSWRGRMQEYCSRSWAWFDQSRGYYREW